jgi:hypothetical protein
MGLLYGRAGRLNAKNAGFRPGQCFARKTREADLAWQMLDMHNIAPRNAMAMVASTAKAKTRRHRKMSLEPADMGSDVESD